MSVYGVYLRDPAQAQLEWFVATKDLPAGQYVLKKRHAESPNVYVAETIAALVLEIGPVLDRMEAEGQRSLETAGTKEFEESIASNLTSQLLGELNESSTIWQHDPRWIHKLRPFS